MLSGSLPAPDADRVDCGNLIQSDCHLPPLRNLAQRRVDQLDLLVAGEAEVDEPLPVKRLRHLLQNLDAPRVVLNQVVVGGEDGGDLALRWEAVERRYSIRRQCSICGDA